GPELALIHQRPAQLAVVTSKPRHPSDQCSAKGCLPTHYPGVLCSGLTNSADSHRLASRIVADSDGEHSSQPRDRCRRVQGTRARPGEVSDPGLARQTE